MNADFLGSEIIPWGPRRGATVNPIPWPYARGGSAPFNPVEKPLPIDLTPPAGVNVQPDPAHGGGIIYNPTAPGLQPLPGTGAPAVTPAPVTTPAAQKSNLLPLLALGAAAYFLMG